MTSTDTWQHDEAAVHTVTLPSIVSSGDLFDGELFGDELIDIYNSSVVEDGTAEENGIPLLPPASDDHANIDEDHPGAQVAATAAAIDDGLGAFRPSTSFNDLSTLLVPSAVTSEPTVPAAAAQVEASPKSTKKRAAVSTAEAPAAKRRVSGSAKSKVKKAVSAKPKQPVPATAKSTNVSVPDATPSSVPAVAAPAAKQPVAATREAPTAAVEKSVPASAPASNNNTEADFKNIAQAAVSNLIHTAKATEAPAAAAPAVTAAASAKKGVKIDTSTAHIKALTGNNWVAACSSAATAVPTAAVSSTTVSATSAAAAAAADAKANNRARRQNLTPDERARQNRDRNREHARNTRLRKKAYVEELKRTLTELVAQRDAAEVEKRQSAQRELEQREVRFRVIEEFLKLRGGNEVNYARWAAILEDGFALVLPVADFYAMGEGATTCGFEQTLEGVSCVMSDASNFGAFLQSLRGPDESNVVTFQYHCDRKNFFMDGCQAVLEWTATSVGSKQEISMKGLFRGKFSPASNKLLSASMSYDTGSIVAQLRAKNLPVGAAQETGALAGDDAAAAAAAHQADALLDSLEMPRINALVPSSVAVVPPGSSSASEASDKGGDSCDESLSGNQD